MRMLFFSAVASIFLLFHAATASESPQDRALDEQQLPATAIPTPRNAAWWYEQSNGYSSIAQSSDRIDIVFLGDSITQGWRDVGRPVWESYYSARHAVNFGIGGDGTEHTLWRIINGNFSGVIPRRNPKAVVLMIGTNNTRGRNPTAIAEGVKANIDAIRERSPQSRILLLAIFPRGRQPQSDERQVVEATNELLRGLADGESVSYLDIGAAFLDRDGSISPEVMPDFLHLSERGYRIWASSMEPALAPLLQ